MIIVGDNASEIELQVAKDVAEYLKTKTWNKPLIKKYSELTEKDKRNYNLIVVGTLKTNPLLEEVYARTNATRVTEEFPGEDKGVLEILLNPWNESKAMLLVESKTITGIALASINMLDGNIEFNKKSELFGYLDFLERRNYQRIHIKVKFKYLPTMSPESRKFETIGLELYDYIPENTYYASVPFDNLEEVSELDIVESVSFLFIEEKLSKEILNTQILEDATWAINPDGTVNLRIRFFRDVSKERAEEILRKYTQNYKGPQILNYWVATIDRNKIYKLAMEDEVQWIEIAPPPPTPLS